MKSAMTLVLAKAPPWVKQEVFPLLAAEIATGQLNDLFTSQKDRDEAVNAILSYLEKTNKNTGKEEEEADMTTNTTVVETKKNGQVKPVEDGKEEFNFKNTKVTKEGEIITVPAGMTYRQAIDALDKQRKEEERKVAVHETIDAFPIEGALAFQKALSKKFGWVDRVPTPGFWGSNPPIMIGVETDVDKMEQVMWGRFEIPGVEGYLETSFEMKDSRFFFTISGEIKQKNMDTLRELCALTQDFVRDESIYKGKAIKVNFPDPRDRANFSPANAPKFIDVSKVNPANLIFSADLQDAVETALFTPVEKTDLCRKFGISLKRGNLLAGVYGVGKTLAAQVLAKKCVENNWTYIYVVNVEHLTQSLLLAKSYAPAVVFVEDIDKAVSGDRDDMAEEDRAKMDKILNTLDGVDTKNDEVMVVFTTNHLESINEAMLRAKRLDYVIEITPPNAEAVQRLIHFYTFGHLRDGEDLNVVGELLAGQIPATIGEVCARAQLSAINRMDNDAFTLELRASDLEAAAKSMLSQLELLKREEETDLPDNVQAATVLVSGASEIARMLSGSQVPNGVKNKTLPAPVTS